MADTTQSRMIVQHLKQKHTQLPRHSYVAVCRQKYRHFLQLRPHYSEGDFHDRLENGMKLRFLHPPLRVFSLFLLFHIFHVALTRCFTLPVGHMQKSSLMSACHGPLPDSPSGHQTKKAFALPCQGLKNFHTSRDCPQ